MPYKTKELQKQYSKRLIEKQKLFLIDLKASTPCKDCDGYFPHFVMEFDHVPERGKKSFSPSSHGISITSKSFLEELKKCDLVCANCHSIRTHRRRFESLD